MVSPQQMLADDALKLAVLLTAQMFHMAREPVMIAVLTGLPEIARLAAVNPLLLARLYAESRTRCLRPSSVSTPGLRRARRCARP
ncbi:MAG: hypothetical protein R2853_11595 [Thermomicrobiales bacterium]